MKILVNEQLSKHRYKDNHGYLICTDCIMARTGKQTYTRDECFGDGDLTEIDVDRNEKEVFSDKTLASFENVPITIEHPSVNVDPDNYNSLAVGHMRDIHKGTYEGKPVMLGTAVITDSEAIEKVESGELTNLSCGYDCDIEDSDNPEQKNIRGNHIALCECPRAGITHIQDSMKKDGIIKVFKKFAKSDIENLRAFKECLADSNVKIRKEDDEYIYVFGDKKALDDLEWIFTKLDTSQLKKDGLSKRKDTIKMPKKRVVTRRTKDEVDYDVIYVELKNGKFMPYEFDASEETRKEAVKNIIEEMGDEVSTIYGAVSNAGPFDILYVNETKDSNKKLRNDSRKPKAHKYIVYANSQIDAVNKVRRLTKKDARREPEIIGEISASGHTAWATGAFSFEVSFDYKDVNGVKKHFHRYIIDDTLYEAVFGALTSVGFSAESADYLASDFED